MLDAQIQAPPGYDALRAKLQIEKNPAKFRILVEEIDRLLREHEKLAASHSAHQPNFLEPSLQVLVSSATS